MGCDVNQCGACELDFAAVDDFDFHRVGVHDYTLSEGLKIGKEDGRHCLSTGEMLELGWGQNALGRWMSPGRVRRQARQGATFARRRVVTPRLPSDQGGAK